MITKIDGKYYQEVDKDAYPMESQKRLKEIDWEMNQAQERITILEIEREKINTNLEEINK